jgi:hypothetical protein
VPPLNFKSLKTKIKGARTLIWAAHYILAPLCNLCCFFSCWLLFPSSCLLLLVFELIIVFLFAINIILLCAYCCSLLHICFFSLLLLLFPFSHLLFFTLHLLLLPYSRLLSFLLPCTSSFVIVPFHTCYSFLCCFFVEIACTNPPTFLLVGQESLGVDN